MKQILVKAFWDEGAKVWYTQSDDLFGLHVEAATTDELEEALKAAIPMLLQDTEELKEQTTIPVKLLQEMNFIAKAGAAA